MEKVEVLILHGSPGSGKNTLARALYEHMRETDQKVAVIDPDELNIVYPRQDPGFRLRNLKAIWPNYATVNGLKVIIPMVIADAKAYEELKNIFQTSKMVVCELTASKSVLKNRVSEREPTDYGKKQLEKWVDIYHERDDSQKFGDVNVSTDSKQVSETTTEILEKIGW